jgi:hypothetical protein
MTSEMTTAFDEVFDTPSAAAQKILADLTPTTDWAPAGHRGLEPDPGQLYNDAFRQVDIAIGELREGLAAVQRKPPRERRTGAAARMNPDDIRMARGVLVGTALFGGAAFVVSFGGQLAMAPYTQLQPGLYWFVPFIVEAPIILLSFMIAVFRRRKQHTAIPWIIIIALTVLSSAINVAHVYIESDGLQTLGDRFGAVVMGIAPILVLVLFEEFVRLAVRPTAETPEVAPAARKTTTRNRKATK